MTQSLIVLLRPRLYRVRSLSKIQRQCERKLKCSDQQLQKSQQQLMAEACERAKYFLTLRSKTPDDCSLVKHNMEQNKVYLDLVSYRLIKNHELLF